jgi:DNA-binding response OmpR family regulator
VNVSKIILTVDRNLRNLDLLAQFLNKAGYSTIQATNLEEIGEALNGTSIIALALVDISGFDRTIWNSCEQIREKHIPLLVLSPRQSDMIQQESLSHGAHSVLVKPLVVKKLFALIRGLTEE